MNDVLRIARLKIALQRAFLGRAILRVIDCLGCVVMFDCSDCQGGSGTAP